MCVANRGTNANVSYESQHVCRDIGTTRPIAEVLGELLFMAVRRRNICLNCHSRHKHLPNQSIFCNFCGSIGVAQDTGALDAANLYMEAIFVPAAEASDMKHNELRGSNRNSE